MSLRSALRSTTITTMVAMAWLVVSCASTPAKPAPVPEAPAAVEKPTPEAPVATPKSPVTDLEFQAAEKAIAEAEEAGAAAFANDLLEGARQDLKGARDQAQDNPDVARGLLKSAVEKANTARDLALKARVAAQEALARQAIAQAEADGADQFAAELLTQARDALKRGQGSQPREALVAFQDAIDAANKAAAQAREARLRAALTDLDRQVQDAIAQAEAVEADQWAPGPLGQARDTLIRARDLVPTQPEAAQAPYRQALDWAQKAKQEAAQARTAALLARIDEALKAWNALPGDLWQPESAGLATEAQGARDAVVTDYSVGRDRAEAAIAALDAATQKLGARLTAARTLGQDAQTALDDAESVDAYVWVPDQVETANDAFFRGTAAWKKYHLDGAEEAWNTALFEAKSAAAKARGELARRQTEQLMLDTMKKLEDASGKTVVDPNDNIIAPQPWDGQKELEKLKTKPVSLVFPAHGEVAVLGEKQRITYLDEAKDQWAQGVKALDAGQLDLANESFLQAQKLIDTYLSLAVDKIYTVRLIPDRRDSLWRIAGYDGIYATPWEWPRIWKRNQKLIQNPDLIYPGWQLIIPPQ